MSPFADSGPTEISDYQMIRTSDDFGRTIEMQYAYRHRGTIQFRAQFPDEITSIDALRAYVQREHEYQYADFQEQEASLGGYPGYQLSYSQFSPTQVEPDCPYDPSECSLYSAEADVYEYYLIYVSDAAPERLFKCRQNLKSQ